MLERVPLAEGDELNDGAPEPMLEIDAVLDTLAEGGTDTSLLEETPLAEGALLVSEGLRLVVAVPGALTWLSDAATLLELSLWLNEI